MKCVLVLTRPKLNVFDKSLAMYDPNDDLLKLSDFTLIIKKALDNSFDTSKNSPYSTTKISKWPALFKENEV
jgi:hypothetical protein